MVVAVVVRRLVEHALGAEVRAQHEPVGDEQVERAVDRRGVDPGQLLAHPRDDLLRAEVAVGLGGEGFPDQRALAGHAAPGRAQLGGARRRRVDVAVRMEDLGHGPMAATGPRRGRGRSRWAARGRGRRAGRGRPRIAWQGPSATMQPRGEDDGAFAELGGEREVVGGDEHGVLDALEDVEQVAAGAGVEVGGRLVEHEQRGVHGQDGGDGHAAALAHRELVRRAVGGVGHAHGVQRLGHALRARWRRSRSWLSGPKATSSSTVGMKSWSSGSWKTRPTRARTWCSVSRPTVRPGDLELSLAGDQAVEVVHEGGLAGAVGAEQRHALAVLDVQVDRRAARGARPGSGRPARGRGSRSSRAQHPQRAGRPASTTATKATSARPSDSGASCGMAPR